MQELSLGIPIAEILKIFFLFLGKTQLRILRHQNPNCFHCLLWYNSQEKGVIEKFILEQLDKAPQFIWKFIQNLE